jgi:uncharacterized protein YecE (DUF72 family)
MTGSDTKRPRTPARACYPAGARDAYAKERGVTIEERYFAGPAGWQYDDWYGTMYPSPRPRGFDALAYVASYFNLVEINSTFYRVPSPATARRWIERVDIHPQFLFTAKAHQAFTHRGSPLAAEFKEFARALSPLADHNRLGAILLQFPWSFRFDAAARTRLDELLRGFNPLPLAVEVRHSSWETDDARAYLQDTGVAVCGVDQPVIGDSLRPYGYRAGAAGSYFRFHGRNYKTWFAPDAGRDARYDYLYTRDELSPWANVVRRAADESQRVFVVLNNHFRGQAPANAFEMASMLLGRAPRAPLSLRRTYPVLRASTSPPDDASADFFEGD